MWKWLVKILGKNLDVLSLPGGEILVEDADYEFQVGTKPTLPVGLRELEITVLPNELLLLKHFDAELTVDQTAWDRTVERIASATRIYRWATCYHELAPIEYSPLRLHADNLLLTDSHYSDNHGPATDISLWLTHMGWNQLHKFDVQVAKSETPLEDAYFTCLRIVGAKDSIPSSSPLRWHQLYATCSSVPQMIAEFVAEEIDGPWGDSRCENYLRECYSGVPREKLTHPVFALIDFPVFDMGMLRTTFAGSIISSQEIRFWSRPTYFHR
jgi:hypothetical protein